MLQPNINLYPPCGWTFPVAGGVVLSGGSKSELIDKLAYWYSARDIAKDPEAEIDAHICNQYPHICRERDPAVPEPKPLAHLAAQRVEYLSRIYRTKEFKPVPQPEETKRRAAACADCKFRTDVPGTCVSCGDNSVFTRAAILSRFEIVEPPVPVASCALYGFDLPVATRLWCASDPAAPQHCWRHPSFVLGPDAGEASAVPAGGSGPASGDL